MLVPVKGSFDKKTGRLCFGWAASKAGVDAGWFPVLDSGPNSLLVYGRCRTILVLGWVASGPPGRR